eukprot:CAMPEP_0116927694 /NCGR_PEP_ID=MMETSP0467-20121206/25522_1 /TAXON_ID=283647 /ORGANISM="Mesodinium pulex, Strain SPMC105" /LENGTH=102 /DNA_ID=CAMNT_0004607289 /DNA_START=423 /DNA_END=731 /DNA_ORIENTATION=-
MYFGLAQVDARVASMVFEYFFDHYVIVQNIGVVFEQESKNHEFVVRLGLLVQLVHNLNFLVCEFVVDCVFGGGMEPESPCVVVSSLVRTQLVDCDFTEAPLD